MSKIIHRRNRQSLNIVVQFSHFKNWNKNKPIVHGNVLSIDDYEGVFFWYFSKVYLEGTQNIVHRQYTCTCLQYIKEIVK